MYSIIEKNLTEINSRWKENYTYSLKYITNYPVTTIYHNGSVLVIIDGNNIKQIGDTIGSKFIYDIIRSVIRRTNIESVLNE